jgi:hypothetical protein
VACGSISVSLQDKIPSRALIMTPMKNQAFIGASVD